jgi:hypothetical protein
MNNIHNWSLKPTIYDTRSIHNLFTWKTEMNFLKCLHLFYNPMHLFSGNNTKFGSVFQLLKEECEKQPHFLFFFISRVFTYYGIKAWQTNESGYWFVDRILSGNIYLEIEKERTRKKPYNKQRRYRFSHLYVATFQHNLHMKYIF